MEKTEHRNQNKSIEILIIAISLQKFASNIYATVFWSIIASVLKGLTSGDSDLQEKAAKEADKIIATEEKQKSTSFGFEKTQINKYENADGPAKTQQSVNEIMNHFIYLFGNLLFLYSTFLTCSSCLNLILPFT